jgi:hypothetical protein
MGSEHAVHDAGQWGDEGWRGWAGRSGVGRNFAPPREWPALIVPACARSYALSMATDTIREMLARDPFEPFRIATSGGESFVIRDPHKVALMKSEVFIVHPRSDRRTFVPLLHVVTVETIGNGHAGRGRRRG